MCTCVLLGIFYALWSVLLFIAVEVYNQLELPEIFMNKFYICQLCLLVRPPLYSTMCFHVCLHVCGSETWRPLVDFHLVMRDASEFESFKFKYSLRYWSKCFRQYAMVKVALSSICPYMVCFIYLFCRDPFVACHPLKYFINLLKVYILL